MGRFASPHAALMALALAALSCESRAQVSVSDAWVRATVAQQKASGAFMQLRAVSAARIVGASSAVAGVVEVHEMTMDGNVMRMRAVDAVDLPAGKTVELKPGGHHVMLMDLKKALNPGDTVPITLFIETGGKRESVQVQASVRGVVPQSSAPSGVQPHSHKH